MNFYINWYIITGIFIALLYQNKLTKLLGSDNKVKEFFFLCCCVLLWPLIAGIIILGPLIAITFILLALAVGLGALVFMVCIMALKGLIMFIKGVLPVRKQMKDINKRYKK